jgi:hypothetical protein
MKTQLLLSVFLFSAFIMQAQYQEQLKIIPPDGQRIDWYGNTIAFSGDGNTMIVGAIYHNTGGVNNAGAAYIYHRNGSQWVFDTEISPAIKIANAGFGYALALSGDGNTAVVGGLASSNYAYLFQKQNGAWLEKRRIQKPYTGGTAGFGSTAAISYNGKTIMIGDLYNAKVSIYEQGANGFQYVTTITDPRGYSEFGIDIALSSKGSTALIGAAQDSGAVAYVYEKINNNWQQTAKINPTDTFAVAWNNIDLSLDGKTAILASDQNIANNNQGYRPGPYIYRKTNQGWLQQAQLIATGTTYTDNPEGVAVSAKGDTASYAVPSKTVGTHEGQGELYIFTYTNNKWVQLQAIHYSNGKAGDYFGSFGFAMAPDTRTVAGGCDEYGIPYGTGYVVTFENDNAFAAESLTATIAKEEPVTGNKIIVVPNPVSSILTLQIKTKLTGLLSIVSNKGVVVRTVNSNQLQQSIDVSGLQSGQYFIKAADINGNLISCSFIKE